jgi:hypothetical protein
MTESKNPYRGKRKCPNCQGSGEADFDICDVCDGSGHYDPILTKGERMCFLAYAAIAGAFALFMTGTMLYNLWKNMQ